MRAVLYDAPGNASQLYIGEAAVPHPGPNELLVQVKVAGLNRADILQREGKYPPPAGASAILGLELSGVVAAIGSQVTRWKVGDRVMGLVPGGGYAELAVIHEEMALPLPQQFTDEMAAAIPEVFLTAYQSLVWLARTRPGETVLIHAGASGVGTAAIQLVQALGARAVITASLSKHAGCLALGASRAFDRRAPDFWEEIRDFTGGVDVIIDPVGGPYFNENLGLLQTDGRLVLLAVMGGLKSAGDVHVGTIVFKRLQVLGSTLRSRPQSYQLRLNREFDEFTREKFAAGQLRPVIDRVFDWTAVREAHEYLEAGRNTGKVLIRID